MPSKKHEQKKNERRDLVKKYKFPILAIFILGVFGDILLTTVSSDIRFFGILAIGILAVFLYRVSSKFFLSLSLLVLFIMFIFFVTTGPAPKTEKAAVWFFLLFATGIIRQWKE